MDAVAALTARSWPNLPSDAERDELQALMGGVLRNVRPVAFELERGFAANEAIPEDIQAAVGHGEEIIVMDFTVRREVLSAFGARFGLAMYYQRTSEILGEGGAVWAHVFTNVQNIRGEALPPALDQALGPALALVQRGLQTEEAFQFATRGLDDHKGVVSFAAFRKSFAVLAVAYERATDFADAMQGDLFRPGFLIGYPL
ncbi:hypothetical protein [Devosia sp.]|uniref:hypothetical protein n=1 Tax=Devosia sp. TaxID=1871048 RepID=UPI00292FB8D7|nr:hypothetical protein [Devosia sp.]